MPYFSQCDCDAPDVYSRHQKGCPLAFDDYVSEGEPLTKKEARICYGLIALFCAPFLFLVFKLAQAFWSMT